MIDLSKASADTLGIYKQVWAFSTDEMNARDQQTIVDYTKAGGNCVLFPYLPDREMSQRPCTIIRDALSVFPSGRETIDSPLIDIFDLKDIKCANPLITYSEESLSGARVIARTINGSACGFEKVFGSGLLIHLGTWTGFDTEDHKLVYKAILKRSDAKLRQASTDNDFIAVRERFTGDNSALLFIGNYYNEEQTGKVIYTHPESNDPITIPYSQDEMLWPALYGVLTPVCLEVSDGLKILHSTSEILGVEEKNDQLEITLYGDRDLAGEIVFEGANVKKIKSATICSEAVKMISDDKRISFIYSHIHKKEMVLNIRMLRLLQ
jgi:beta-galactosidase